MPYDPSRCLRCVTVLYVLSFLATGSVTAQSPPAPTHQHYERSSRYEQAAPGVPLAPRLQNLGVHTFKVTTRSERAQAFVNQGVNLAYAFNHAEAARAFAEAARLDPDCAMAYWGHALVLGPNINAAMAAEDEPRALELIQRAASLKKRATPRERAYIDALTARYTGNPADRRSADHAYADAMRKLVAAHPADLDARTLFAESLMDLRPWNYWSRDGVPYPETREVEAALAQVLTRNPRHPGALHYWVHLWEPTDTPERAEAEADRLLPLMPAAGHVVHMPAHIYMRVGRHADVVKSNLLAVKADEDYIAQCRAQGIYPLGYYPHNLHFVWMGATASGQRGLALEYARKVAAAVPDAALKDLPVLQGFLVVPYWAMVRFGQWAEILDDKGPRLSTPFTNGVRHYARAMAFIATERLSEAEEELAQLKVLVADPSLKGPTTFSTNTGYAILRIAPEVVEGEIAARRKNWDAALLHLERAVRYEDALVYQEPPDWHAPVRQNLGTALLEAGRADEAESVFWEDLKRNTATGWGLHGLLQALRAQGKAEEAGLIQQRFEAAWKDADFSLPAARTGSTR